jgi:hypothetical protein
LYKGLVTTYAGSPLQTGFADGAITSASLTRPIGVAVDTSGVVYVSDLDNAAIRMITTSGVYALDLCGIQRQAYFHIAQRFCIYDSWKFSVIFGWLWKIITNEYASVYCVINVE